MKSLFTTKTFWFNVLTLLYVLVTKHVEALGGLQLDPQNTALISTGVNVLIRLFTSKAVYVTNS